MANSLRPHALLSANESWFGEERAKVRLYRPAGPVQTYFVKLYETSGRVGSGGVLTLHHLPFPNGDEVKVRVESATETATPRAAFVFGLHTRLVTVSEDFDAALPDSFWLGEDETPA